MKRTQISLDDELIKKIDAYTATVGISRSAFLNLAAAEYLSAKEKAPLVSGIFSRYAALVDDKVCNRISSEQFTSSVGELDAAIQSLASGFSKDR